MDAELLLTGNHQRFCDCVKKVAAEAPSYFSAVMYVVYKQSDDMRRMHWLDYFSNKERACRMSMTTNTSAPNWMELLWKWLFESRRKKKRDEREKERMKKWDESREQAAIDEFVRLCSNAGKTGNKQSEKLLESFLTDLYNSDAARPMLMLLKRADLQTIREFAKTQLSEGRTARWATVDVVVREIKSERLMRGNTGRYLIHLKKDNEEQQLKFVNQASTVFYLMFLISRCQPDHLLAYPELRLNKEPFLQLYKMVYPLDDRTILQKTDVLLHRYVDHEIRAGRLHEIIYDIRRQLESQFKAYGEDFQPYAMSAHQHLTIGAEHIQFEGEARQLLKIPFV